ncbi:MAG: hypothetical protein JRI36_01090 [Deltaproteobacteria bacterium]|nr:hypothetical protein [Deltaproteobacteria bacterium]
MKTVFRVFGITVVLTALCVPQPCFGITPEGLTSLQNQGTGITIVDVRNGREYTLGHIPNAINIPARIVPVKALPPLGRVIVYGDGIQTGVAMKAAAALNRKPGIQAEILEGGYAAWQASHLPSTGRRGVRAERFHFITYQELQQATADNKNIVLVDLRYADAARKAGSPGRLSADGNRLSNLSERIPNVDIITLGLENRGSAMRAGEVSIAAIMGDSGRSANRFYVLVDSGNGSAEKVARRLAAAGITSVAILAGGERALKRKGLPGLTTQVTKD